MTEDVIGMDEDGGIGYVVRQFVPGKEEPEVITDIERLKEVKSVDLPDLPEKPGEKVGFEIEAVRID